MNDPIQVRLEVLGKKIPIKVYPDDELFVRGVVECVNEMHTRTRQSSDELLGGENAIYYTLLLMGEHIIDLRNSVSELTDQNRLLAIDLQRLLETKNALQIEIERLKNEKNERNVMSEGNE